MKREDLDGALLAAHEREDALSLIRLYQQAGEESEQAGDIDAACFYYTHAYVFALESGNVVAKDLHGKLEAYGRESGAVPDFFRETKPFPLA